MKNITKQNRFLTRGAALLILMLFACIASAKAQTTAFTYQGRLTDGAAAANGSYDLGFALYSAATGGTVVGSPKILSGVSVTNGVFTVQLDFGANPFTSGADRFLEIAVKRPTDQEFTVLTPRQQLTASPFSIQSLSATTANGLSNNCVACVTNAQINSVDGSKITGTVANATSAANALTATSFSGNLVGDVTGTQTSTVVGKVGTQTAAVINTAVTAVGNATNLNNANAIVKRDASGNFIAGTITATNFNGNATSATNATNFSGLLTGDVGGTQSATVIQPNAVTAGKIASNQVVKSINGLKDSVTLTGNSGITLSQNGNTLDISLTNPSLRKFVVGGLVGGYQYNVDHNLNTVDVTVQIYDAAGFLIRTGNTSATYSDAFVKVLDANHILVGVYPAGTFRIVVTG